MLIVIVLYKQTSQRLIAVISMTFKQKERIEMNEYNIETYQYRDITLEMPSEKKAKRNNNGSSRR